MKELFKSVTLVSLFALVFTLPLAHLIFQTLPLLFFGITVSSFAKNLLLGLAEAVSFSLCYLYFYRARNGLCQREAFADFQAERCPSLLFELKTVLRREKGFLLTVFGINLLTWLLAALENLLFHRRIVSAVLVLYAPLNVIGAVSEKNSLLFGFLLGTPIVLLSYLLTLCLWRRRLRRYFVFLEQNREVV